MNQVERLAIHDYILGLEEPVTVDDMKPLIGEKFPVLDTGTNWGKEVVTTDYLKITAVKFRIDVETGLSDGVVMVHSDYHFDGNIKFNAWAGIKGLQRYVKNYLNT